MLWRCAETATELPKSAAMFTLGASSREAPARKCREPIQLQAESSHPFGRLDFVNRLTLPQLKIHSHRAVPDERRAGAAEGYGKPTSTSYHSLASPLYRLLS